MTIKNIKQPNTHDNCFLCGWANPHGFHLKFEEIAPGEVKAKTRIGEKHQGYTGILHGGIIASVLDSAMCNAIFSKDIEAVTVDMNIRFLNEAACGSELEVEAKITDRKGPLYYTEAKVYANDKILARANAKFIKRGVL